LAAPYGRPGTSRVVLRDQVAAAVTKTGYAHPRPASRRSPGGDGARFFISLVTIVRPAESLRVAVDERNASSRIDGTTSRAEEQPRNCVS
jgi:hypothetical protein